MVKITLWRQYGILLKCTGDCMCVDSLRDAEICLYDIDAERLKESG